MPDVRFATAAAALILALCACAEPIPKALEPEMNEKSKPEAAKSGQTQGAEAPTAAQSNIASAGSEIRSAVIEDLAARLSVAQTAIVVHRFQAMTWNDGSMGCPEPGMGYTQALVPGYWIVLEHDGRHYDYRASRRGHFVACKNPSAKPGGRADAPDA